jgi:hypothetical protein
MAAFQPDGLSPCYAENATKSDGGPTLKALDTTEHPNIGDACIIVQHSFKFIFPIF